jgi:hypothetical protein
MLVCSDIDSSGGSRGIQLVVADERKTPAAVVQRIQLQDGYVPQLLFASDTEAPTDIMLRVILANDNTEAHVYSINPVTGRLTDTLTVTRAFPEKMKLEVTGVMTEGGVIEIESKKPARKVKIDLSEVLDSLIEDELYREDGRVIPAMENLTLVRNGWEDERFGGQGGKVFVEVGMSLVTLSKKPVIDVTGVLTKNNDSWTVSGLTFGPSLPYRSE